MEFVEICHMAENSVWKEIQKLRFTEMKGLI